MADERQNLQDGNDGDLELLTGRWAAPMTFSDVRALCETAHKMTKEEASRRDETEGDCLVQVPGRLEQPVRGVHGYSDLRRLSVVGERRGRR